MVEWKGIPKTCKELLKNLDKRSQERAECLTDGTNCVVLLNLDGLKSDEAFSILNDVKDNVPKSVRIHISGVFTL